MRKNPSGANELEGFVLKTTIVANGEISDQKSAAAILASTDLIIAADGGAHHCLELDHFPHLVIGDFDSLDSPILNRLRNNGVELIEHPRRKDATDLELALLEAKQRGATELSILGAVGGRWDQTLANFHLIASPRWRGLEVKVVDGTQHVYPIHPNRALDLHGEPGDLVSLIPLGGDAEGVHAGGLEYPLEGERLSYEQSRGISNRLINSTALISITRGILLCVVIHGGEETLE